MFVQPIKHVRLSTLEELLNFSHRTVRRAQPFTRWQNNGQIAFVPESGFVHVTPYRPEIHELLAANGFRESGIYVPFSNGEERPLSYQWLEKIAAEERLAYTCEKALQVAQEKGIAQVSFKTSHLRIREVTEYQKDLESSYRFSPMVHAYLLNGTDQNVATYIVVDARTVLLCDEYGRTFIVRAKSVISDFVNALIDAGYTRTTHPELYVVEDEENSESTEGDSNE